MAWPDNKDNVPDIETSGHSTREGADRLSYHKGPRPGIFHSSNDIINFWWWEKHLHRLVTYNYAEMGHLGVYGKWEFQVWIYVLSQWVETFNCMERKENIVCSASNIVWWLGSLNICAVPQLNILPQYSSSCPATVSSLHWLTFHFPMDFSTRWESGAEILLEIKRKVVMTDWQPQSSRLLRPEICRWWGKGRLVLKFPLIAFSTAARWL